MELIAFDSNLSNQDEPQSKWGVSEVQTRPAKDIVPAVTYLVQHKSLTHSFGSQSEWEVRTALLTNRQPWRYYSTVLLHGKEASKEFPAIKVDQTRHIQPLGAVTEEMIAAFAREAVEAHFARCASVAEYSLMTSIFSQPAPRLQRVKKVTMVLFSVVVLLTASWWWQGTHRRVLEPPVQTPWTATDSAVPEQPESKPLTHSVRWQSFQVTHVLSAGEPFEFPLPALERVPGGLPVEVMLEASQDAPRWLEFDRERLSIRGTAPLTTIDQTYHLSVRAHTETGSDSRLLLLLTITGQHDRTTPTPQLRGHWTW
jgi:hypothetical protein